MSSDNFDRYQTEDVNDLATAKLALRWSLEKIRQLDDDVQRMSNRMIAKEEEASRLSKELAHQSTVSMNEKDISGKTTQLLEEYRELMNASMEQLWKKFAPQEADAKKQLQDKVTALEHDLLQMGRTRNLSEENTRRSEDNLGPR